MNIGYSTSLDYNMYYTLYSDTYQMPLPFNFGDDAMELEDLDISEHLGKNPFNYK